MLFNHFLLERMTVLERATRGYGECLPERSLFATLTQDHAMPVDEFLVLLQWGQLTGLIREQNTETGRRYVLDRSALADLRTKANGEGRTLVQPPRASWPNPRNNDTQPDQRDAS